MFENDKNVWNYAGDLLPLPYVDEYKKLVVVNPRAATPNKCYLALQYGTSDPRTLTHMTADKDNRRGFVAVTEEHLVVGTKDRTGNCFVQVFDRNGNAIGNTIVNSYNDDTVISTAQLEKATLGIIHAQAEFPPESEIGMAMFADIPIDGLSPNDPHLGDLQRTTKGTMCIVGSSKGLMVDVFNSNGVCLVNGELKKHPRTDYIISDDLTYIACSQQNPMYDHMAAKMMLYKLNNIGKYTWLGTVWLPREHSGVMSHREVSNRVGALMSLR